MPRILDSGTGVLLLLTGMLLVGCGGAKKDAPAHRAYVRVNLRDSSTQPAMDASGAVALSPYPPPVNWDYDPNAVVWKEGAFNDIGQAFDDTSKTIDINDSGQVLLQTYNDETATGKTYLYTDGDYREIHIEGTDIEHVIPVSLSNDGTVLGYCILNTVPPLPRSNWEFPKPFLWRNGTTTMLDGASVKSLNEQGQYLVRLGEVSFENFPWGLGQPNGPAIPLSEIASGAEKFDPQSINDHGVIVGALIQGNPGQPRPGVIRNGKLQNVLANPQSGLASAVNNRGDIVGTVTSGPFLVRSTGEFLDLSDLFPDVSESEQKDIRLHGINDDGQIIGTVQYRVFVLKPRSLAR
jgi:hypothetical protein